MSESTERIIIGETERAGLPISAPVGRGGMDSGSIRWVKRENSFVLQQLTYCITKNGFKLEWLDVPCDINPNA